MESFQVLHAERYLGLFEDQRINNLMVNKQLNGKPFGRIIGSLALHAFNRLGISFKYKLNSRGERTHPCRTPRPLP